MKLLKNCYNDAFLLRNKGACVQIDYHVTAALTKNLSLLYAEDDPFFLKETQEIFKELFAHVDTASNGEEALAVYQNFKTNTGKYYDLVVTDINMPKMNGIELIKTIYTCNPDQSIIVISAHSESKYLLELINMGIEQFLLKPNNYDTMLHVLHQSASKIATNQKTISNSLHVKLSHNLTWNTQTSLLLDQGNVIKLTKNETLLMALFIKNHYKISTLGEIFDLLWPNEPHLASVETLKSIISRLRKKLPSVIIENIYSLGYRMVIKPD
nr:response regulator transcription factor [Sulfurospirillum tamanensis]